MYIRALCQAKPHIFLCDGSDDSRRQQGFFYSSPCQTGNLAAQLEEFRRLSDHVGKFMVRQTLDTARDVIRPTGAMADGLAFHSPTRHAMHAGFDVGASNTLSFVIFLASIIFYTAQSLAPYITDRPFELRPRVVIERFAMPAKPGDNRTSNVPNVQLDDDLYEGAG